MMGEQRASFIHLRTHSAYSLSEGAIHVPQLVALTKQHAMPAVALTDSSNLFAALEFSMAAAKEGVQPIIGTTVNLATPSTKPGQPNLDGKLVLLAQNLQGYHNLIKLVSNSFLNGEDTSHPAITLDDLQGISDGIIALTGGAGGLIGHYLAHNKPQEAEALLLQLKALFLDRLYMELSRHGADLENRTEQPMIDLAYQHNIPLVATNDVVFPTRDLFEAQDVLMCIASGRYVSETNRDCYTPEHYFKSSEEMVKLFSDLPEAIANTQVISQRCAVMAEPHAPMLPSCLGDKGVDEAAEFTRLAREGLQNRLNQNPDVIDSKPYEAQLAYEIDIIIQMGFHGYFLIVSDFIIWAKEHGIPVGPGRGSGAGSVVAWALNITDLDPLRYGLLFERFLNPERVSMPDFDIDFCQDRREEVIHYVQEKYGKERVAQIITFGKLQARAVIRDVGRVLQMPYSQTDRICKMIPNNPANPLTLQQAIDLDPDLKKAIKEDEQVARLMDIGLKLEGMYRHCSTHAAGIVIGRDDLTEVLPLYKDHRSAMPATQFSMKYTELAGMVKFDFLGLKTLTTIDNACKLIREQGMGLDIHTIPLNDKKTFEMLSHGESTGVFQMESSGMRDALRKMKPDCIEDIIALISLYRPGPMENIPTYITRKHGKEAPDYLHPKLEPCLKETYGVIIYQEQVMEIAKVLAGYSLGEADLLRRAMGKKIKEEMDQQRESFMEGAKQNNVDPKKAGHIFDLVAKFAGYGFNKSHAAAYALIGYQTAYLKANYPVEFLTASMNIDIGDTDKLNIFRDEALRNHITILPPDINRSHAYFSVEKLTKDQIQPDGHKRAIRWGLGALKGVGVDSMEALVATRKDEPFTDIYTLAQRCDNRVMNKRQLEGLARAGTFDSMYPARRQLVEGASQLVRYSQTLAEEKATNQNNLFGEDSITTAPPSILPDIEDWEPAERLQHEKDVVGFYLTAHPLDPYAYELDQIHCLRINSLEEKTTATGGTYRIAGMVSSLNIRASKRGRFAYVGISDSTGSIELSVFDEKLLNEHMNLFTGNQPLLFTVDISRDEGSIRLRAKAVTPLNTYLEQRKYDVTLQMAPDAANAIHAIHAFLDQQERGRTKIHLTIPTTQQMLVTLTLPEIYRFNHATLQTLHQLPGVAQLCFD